MPLLENGKPSLHNYEQLPELGTFEETAFHETPIPIQDSVFCENSQQPKNRVVMSPRKYIQNAFKTCCHRFEWRSQTLELNWYHTKKISSTPAKTYPME
jgi:hypothetical protein